MTFLVDGSLGGTFPTWTTATRPATPATGQEGFNTTTGVLEVYNGSAWFAAGTIAPTVTTYTSSSGTYTTPAGAKYLTVKMVGGGGGGGGCGVFGTNGTGGTGGTTTFGTSLLTCNGGVGGNSGGNAPDGGAATIASPAITIAACKGVASGQAGATNIPSFYYGGNSGGASPFGGNGLGTSNGAGAAAVANTGSGGGAAGVGGTATFASGAGGASGGYIEAIITSPSATYSYAVGAAGTSGTAGTNGSAGGAGGSGYIVVTAYF
jgi:hypothetical protein